MQTSHDTTLLQSHAICNVARAETADPGVTVAAWRYKPHIYTCMLSLLYLGAHWAVSCSVCFYELSMTTATRTSNGGSSNCTQICEYTNTYVKIGLNDHISPDNAIQTVIFVANCSESGPLPEYRGRPGRFSDPWEQSLTFKCALQDSCMTHHASCPNQS